MIELSESAIMKNRSIVFCSAAYCYIISELVMEHSKYLHRFIGRDFEKFGQIPSDLNIRHFVQLGYSLALPTANVFAEEMGFKITAVVGAFISMFGLFISLHVNHFFLTLMTMGIISGMGTGTVTLASLRVIVLNGDEYYVTPLYMIHCIAIAVSGYTIKYYEHMVFKSWQIATIVDIILLVSVVVCLFFSRSFIIEGEEDSNKQGQKSIVKPPQTTYYNMDADKAPDMTNLELVMEQALGPDLPLNFMIKRIEHRKTFAQLYRTTMFRSEIFILVCFLAAFLGSSNYTYLISMSYYNKLNNYSTKHIRQTDCHNYKYYGILFSLVNDFLPEHLLHFLFIAQFFLIIFNLLLLLPKLAIRYLFLVVTYGYFHMCVTSSFRVLLTTVVNKRVEFFYGFAIYSSIYGISNFSFYALYNILERHSYKFSSLVLCSNIGALLFIILTIRKSKDINHYI